MTRREDKERMDEGGGSRRGKAGGKASADTSTLLPTASKSTNKLQLISWETFRT